MPFAGFVNFDACVVHMKGKGHSEEEARKICGAMERDQGKHMAAFHKPWKMEAMALEIPEFPEHPNRVPFSGVLTQLDTPSDVPPNGAEGHRVVLPSAVAERALASLLGMAVNYRADFDGHDARRKVGVITRAEVAGGALEVGGYIFGKDFPDVVQEIRARREAMGMSYEVTDVEVADAEADVWTLSNVVFTGAAILEKESAAFKRTSLAATAGQGGTAMDEQLKKSVLASIEEWFAKKFGGQQNPSAAAFTEADAKRIATEAAGVVKTELGAQLTALTEENKQLKAAASAGTLEARRAKWNAAVTLARSAGKLVPALLVSLAAQAELAIAATSKVKVQQLEADGKTTKEVEVDSLDALIQHVEALPQIVPLGVLGDAAQRSGNVIEMKFNVGKGQEVDAESQTINARAEQIAADLRKQDPKLSELAAFKEGLTRARQEYAGATAKAGGIAAGKV